MAQARRMAWFGAEAAPEASGPARATRPWAFKVGEVAGIGIYVHATLALFLGWVAMAYLARGEPAEALSGILASVAVFVIIALHELGHALVALRFGIRTTDITLLPIGGVARLERIPQVPRQELLIAIAGPAVNVALAILFYGLAKLLGHPMGADALRSGASLPVTLMWINVSLALFNLLPAFPMDGGRVLRAALALRLPYVRATELAARIGQAMALAFGLAGMLANPMLLLIAYFVWTGARQEASLVQVEAALSGIPVDHAMITEFKTLPANSPLSLAARELLSGFQQDFPVTDEAGHVVGLVGRQAIARGLVKGGEEAPVSSAMETDFTRVDPAEPIERALGRLQERDAQAALVVREDHVIGMVTPENVGELLLMNAAQRRSAFLRAARGGTIARIAATR